MIFRVLTGTSEIFGNRQGTEGFWWSLVGGWFWEREGIWRLEGGGLVGFEMDEWRWREGWNYVWRGNWERDGRWREDWERSAAALDFYWVDFSFDYLCGRGRFRGWDLLVVDLRKMWCNKMVRMVKDSEFVFYFGDLWVVVIRL